MPATRSTTPHDASLRDRILAETVAILGAEGPSALTVRRVAAQAGCSTIGVYTHFHDKAGLVEAALVEGFDDLDAALAAVDGTGVDRLHRAAHAYRRWALDHRHGYLVMFAPSTATVPVGPPAAVRGARSFAAHLERTRDAVERGELVGDPVEDVALALWAHVHGWVMVELLGVTAQWSTDVDAAFEAGVRALLAGCAAPR